MCIGIEEFVVLQCLDLSRGIVRKVFNEFFVLFTDVSQKIVGKTLLVLIVAAIFPVGPAPRRPVSNHLKTYTLF